MVTSLFKHLRAFCLAHFLYIGPVPYSFFMYNSDNHFHTTKTFSLNYSYFHSKQGNCVILNHEGYLWQLQSYLRGLLYVPCLKHTVFLSIAHRIKSTVAFEIHSSVPLINEQHLTSLALPNIRDCSVLSLGPLSIPTIYYCFSRSISWFLWSHVYSITWVAILCCCIFCYCNFSIYL